jgi:hypothetical protein
MPPGDSEGCLEVPITLRFPARFAGTLAMASRNCYLPLTDTLSMAFKEFEPNLLDLLNEWADDTNAASPAVEGGAR